MDCINTLSAQEALVGLHWEGLSSHMVRQFILLMQDEHIISAYSKQMQIDRFTNKTAHRHRYASYIRQECSNA